MKRAQTFRLTDEQRRLVEANLKLAYYTVWRYGTWGIESRDDACQIAAIGLMKAAHAHKGKDAPFSAFACNCILHELNDQRKHQMRACRGHGKRPTSLDSFICNMGSCRHKATRLNALASTDPGVEDILLAAEEVRQLHELLHTLPRTCAEILEDYYWRGLEQTELATRYSTSQATISRRLSRATHELRELYAMLEADA